MTRTATFAAGCFWKPEIQFARTPGVESTRVGYTGGQTANPSYEDVCGGGTGHAEAVEVAFDPDRISYEQLLDVFWQIHDPTQKDRQGPDIGHQYRSAIFYHDESQRAAAEASKQRQQSQLSQPIQTEIVPAATFYPAEEYHQRFLEKRGLA